MQISKSTNVIFYIFDFQSLMCDLWHGVQFSLVNVWSMTRSAIFAITWFDGKYQNLQMSPTNFWAISYHFRQILNILFSISRSRSQSAIFTIAQFDGKCQNLQMSSTHFFCTSSYCLWEINILNFWPWKCR